MAPPMILKNVCAIMMVIMMMVHVGMSTKPMDQMAAAPPKVTNTIIAGFYQLACACDVAPAAAPKTLQTEYGKAEAPHPPTNTLPIGTYNLGCKCTFYV